MDFKMQEDVRTDVKAIGSIAVGSVSAFLHPFVIMNISEHWTRLKAQDEGKPQPVFGALIGKQKGRNIEIMNSFELSYSIENGNVIIDKAFYLHKKEQFKQVFPDLNFLGWYTTGDQSDFKDINGHKQMLEIDELPVFLKLNPPEVQNKLPIKMYELVNNKATVLFVEINYTLVTEEAEDAQTDSSIKQIIKGLNNRVNSLYQLITDLESHKSSDVTNQILEGLKINISHIQCDIVKMFINQQNNEIIKTGGINSSEQFIINGSEASLNIYQDSIESFMQSPTRTSSTSSPLKSKKYDNSLSSMNINDLKGLIGLESVNELINQAKDVRDLIKFDTSSTIDLKNDLNKCATICFDANGFPSAFTSENLVSNYVFVVFSYIISSFKKKTGKSELYLFTQHEIKKKECKFGGIFDYAVCDSSDYSLKNTILFVECKLKDPQDGYTQCLGYLNIKYEHRPDQPIYAISISGQDWSLMSYQHPKYILYSNEDFLSPPLLSSESQFTRKPLLIEVVYQILLEYYKLELSKNS